MGECITNLEARLERLKRDSKYIDCPACRKTRSGTKIRLYKEIKQAKAATR